MINSPGYLRVKRRIYSGNAVVIENTHPNLTDTKNTIVVVEVQAAYAAFVNGGAPRSYQSCRQPAPLLIGALIGDNRRQRTQSAPTGIDGEGYGRQRNPPEAAIKGLRAGAGNVICDVLNRHAQDAAGKCEAQVIPDVAVQRADALDGPAGEIIAEGDARAATEHRHEEGEHDCSWICLEEIDHRAAGSDQEALHDQREQDEDGAQHKRFQPDPGCPL